MLSKDPFANQNYYKESLNLRLPLRAGIFRDQQIVIPTPTSYAFETVTIKKDNEIICWIIENGLPDFSCEAEFTAKNYNRLKSLTGRAKCHPDDKYNAITGFKLAQSRLISSIYAFLVELSDKYVVDLQRPTGQLVTRICDAKQYRQAIVAPKPAKAAMRRYKYKKLAKAKPVSKTKTSAKAKSAAK